MQKNNIKCGWNKSIAYEYTVRFIRIHQLANEEYDELSVILQIMDIPNFRAPSTDNILENSKIDLSLQQNLSDILLLICIML